LAVVDDNGKETFTLVMSVKPTDLESRASLVLSKDPSNSNVNQLRKLIDAEAPLAAQFFVNRDDELRE
jgi:hypothetical protein